VNNTRTIVDAVRARNFLRVDFAPYVHHINGDVSVMIFKYNECSPFKYEVVAHNGLVLRFGGEAYPPLPVDVEVTIGMVDNYPYDGRKHSNVIGESWETFINTPRAGMWSEKHYGLDRILGADEFVRDVGCLIETVEIFPTVLKVYSVHMKTLQFMEIQRGYPRGESEGKSEKNPT
jgi:hypothetical protein